jgi:CRISPR/Cas system-associated protein Cas10 (large subunit of type III CRISPR-Cas system)
MKRCRVCGELKPLDAFYRARGMKDGYRGECKPCFKASAKARYDSPTAVARAKQWRVDNRERHRAYQAEYRARPERKRAMRDLYYRRTFGLSADDVDAMLEAQGGGCAICGTKPERLASLHVDHCHGSGRIRGLLCLNCNQGIGKLGEDPERLRRAAEYLTRTR